MKIIGGALLGFGIVGILSALSMDTTVQTGGETIGYGEFSTYIPTQRVHNIGLMDEKRNYLVMSAVAAIVGAILFGFGVLADGRTRTAGPTPEQAKAEQARLAQLAQWEENRRRSVEEQNRQREESRQKRQAAFTAAGQACREFGQAVVRAPGHFDRLLRKAAGEENDILYRFLQLVVYVALPIVLVLIVASGLVGL